MSAKSVAVVIGENVRRIRERDGITLSAVADGAVELGAKWNAAAVRRIEAGTFDVTVSAVVVLVYALTRATGRPVTTLDILDAEGPIAITDTDEVMTSDLLAILGGGAVEDRLALTDFDWPKWFDGAKEAMKGYPPGVKIGEVRKYRKAPTEQDVRLAKSFGLSAGALHAWAVREWGRGFFEERDNRAGPDANAQKKGIVARQLKAELKAAIDGDD
ncbi:MULTISPECIES: hypothetical protein [Mycobacteroides]|uniref:hypothetical protein n=1 Tax=Mycobacteroides TaxID=670516 RepID=UPI0005E55B01|nr:MULTISPECIES: hypothetical protein [Mycobacteroides]MBN7428938.1 hypothetical protein [Mycobacteroides abscessus subsp. massiliense]MBN7466594.1 hypothetical protein [Mycobacteroides abscessus subsp. massiliense]MBN7496033.1 hypothetical protein [Mycobacteroides abscessus subsp. abscessus]MBN7527112.1 hypothetical protein [Mycobacteroides abscessus subsp. massiliense]MBN7528584.1 hypothetical protein [Mycobacteroides abscessus subsp. abscessus]